MNSKKDNYKEEIGAPVRLDELAPYNPGSIVSRSIKKAETGNITFFAFAKGEQLSPHSAPYDAFVQIVEGQASVMIEETWHKMQAGEVIVLPANIPHAVKAPENMKMLLVMIKA